MNTLHCYCKFKLFYLTYIPSYRKYPGISYLLSFKPKLNAESVAHDSELL